MTTTWTTDDGREYRGREVHITWPTAGTHTVTKRRDDGTTRTITVTTVEEPIESWPVIEYGLNPGLVPHTGTLVPTEVGGYATDGVTPATEMLPDPEQTAPRGTIPASYPRAGHRFATDYDPAGTMDWPDLLDAMSVGLTATNRAWLVLDHEPPAGQEYHVYPHAQVGYARGRASCYRLDAATGVRGLVGTGRQALAAPERADDTKLIQVWNRNSAVDAQLASWGRTPDGQGRLWATAKQMGNITAKGGQHECRLIELKGAGVTLANLAFLPPGGKPDGEVDIIGCNGIDIRDAADVTLAHLHARGMSKGWEGFPPGETAQIAVVNHSTRLYFCDSTIDGSRPDGTRVAGSPFSVASSTSTARWQIERVTEMTNRVSMHTYWNANVNVRRLHHRTIRVAGPHTNEEDFNWLDGYEFVTIGDEVDVMSRYDGTGTSDGGPTHVTCTSGPRAKDTKKSNQLWVNWTANRNAFQHFVRPTASNVLSVQSQLGYVGVDGSMGETGPATLQLDGIDPPMGWRAWENGRWQNLAGASAKAELRPDGSLYTPVRREDGTLDEAPTRPWPTGMGETPDRKVAFFR